MQGTASTEAPSFICGVQATRSGQSSSYMRMQGEKEDSKEEGMMQQPLLVPTEVYMSKQPAGATHLSS